jgi:hypothetical protein
MTKKKRREGCFLKKKKEKRKKEEEIREWKRGLTSYYLNIIDGFTNEY